MLNLSQAYRFNSKNLNCSRHVQIFNKNNIIPKFCFNCYKVQVDAEDVIDLIKLQLFFDKEKLLQDHTRKCMVELRDQFPGFYKGIIYCETYEEVKYLSEKIKILIQKKINSRFEFQPQIQP